VTKINAAAVGSLIGGGAPGAADRLANRTRRIFVSGAEFYPSTAVTNHDAGAAITTTPRASAWLMRDATTDSGTATFMVPMDYIAGQAIPPITVYTGSSATGKFGFEIAFGRFSEVTNTANNAWNKRYEFYSGAGNTTGDSQEESFNITTAASLQTMTMPATDVYLNSPTLWQPGDIIVITITRKSSNTPDTNSGNLYLYGVSFDYTGDM
jgi:hypothetical protein